MSRAIRTRLERLEHRGPEGFVCFVQTTGESREALYARVEAWRRTPGKKPQPCVVYIRRNRWEER
jgi:hypothetical protein